LLSFICVAVIVWLRGKWRIKSNTINGTRHSTSLWYSCSSSYGVTTTHNALW